jgi:hypothetical protein
MYDRGCSSRWWIDWQHGVTGRRHTRSCRSRWLINWQHGVTVQAVAARPLPSPFCSNAILAAVQLAVQRTARIAGWGDLVQSLPTCNTTSAQTLRSPLSRMEQTLSCGIKGTAGLMIDVASMFLVWQPAVRDSLFNLGSFAGTRSAGRTAHLAPSTLVLPYTATSSSVSCMMIGFVLHVETLGQASSLDLPF